MRKRKQQHESGHPLRKRQLAQERASSMRQGLEKAGAGKTAAPPERLSAAELQVREQLRETNRERDVERAARSRLMESMAEIFSGPSFLLAPGAGFLPSGAMMVPATHAPFLRLGVNRDVVAQLANSEPYRVKRPAPEQRIPDYIEVITAWRAWGLATGGTLRLEAIGNSVIWPERMAMRASCLRRETIFDPLWRYGSPPCHRAPEFHCTCGVWAFKTMEELLGALNSTGGAVKVLGKVSLWGRVIETEHGYRAEYAYPAELWLLDPAHEELGYIYDVPVRSAPR